MTRTPCPFVLAPQDAVYLVNQSIRKLERLGNDPNAYPEIRDAIDSLLSRTVLHLRDMAVLFEAEQRPFYDLLNEFLYGPKKSR